ncbi:MAG: PKD domain-containing protein [Flavobacteriales bacterium]|nr:PKD domain-containing protein [Flavobacteriales bacterium]
MHICLSVSTFQNGLKAQLPDGFQLEEVITEIEFPMGIEFLSEDKMLSWNNQGQVFLVEEGELQPTPIIDLSEEIGQWHDHGLLDVVVHPEFQNNGYIYLYYVVDRHHLLHYGTASYHPDSNDYFNATIARLTRYSLAEDFTPISGSRNVLIGSEIDNGVSIMAISHAGGSMNFGTDGSLLLTTGDGTWKEYIGEGPVPDGNYDDIALEDGIIRADENIGSWRSQYVNSLNGKVLRLNPITGEGYPSNPYYDESDPSSARSRVWAFGLRNPFRACLNPLTGSTDPGQANPGTLYIGDVGNWMWEELNIANGAGMNFGWPLYEGMGIFWLYDELETANLDEPNPIGGDLGCPEYFSFHDLIQVPTAEHSGTFTNPCDDLTLIDDSVVIHTHDRPALTWNNLVISPQVNSTFVPSFNEAGEAISVPVEDTELEIDPFTGSASIGGDIYLGDNYPEEYFGAYFQSDYAGWMKVFFTNEAEEVVKVEDFLEMSNIVQTKFNPYDGHIYITTIFPDVVHRLTYGGNRAPVIDLNTSSQYGSSPLEVTFDASGTIDPDDDPLTFSWTFGDGETATGDIVSHIFTSPDSDPFSLTTTLTVQDTAGNLSTSEILISLNNTPPEVSIANIEDDQEYNGQAGEELSLSSEVVDLEHSEEELEYHWEVLLHHNSHFHLEEAFTESQAETHLQAIGCNTVETYYYRITLEVTDAAGLKGYDEKYLYPNCDSSLVIGPNFDSYIVYPNPSQGSFTIRGPFESEEAFTLQVIDLSGRVVLDEFRTVDDFNRIGLSLNGLSGQYILRIIGNGLNESMRILVID